jgi:hypothetical protein
VDRAGDRLAQGDSVILCAGDFKVGTAQRRRVAALEHPGAAAADVDVQSAVAGQLAKAIHALQAREMQQ